ncbi:MULTISPECIES: serine/threonine-protein kinase [Mycolicibacterium]|uniref:non-specific serine/threonine protein kinase n=1 Tax=Mycolicibacterium senegalense TaxID=1796 RepID=A0A378T246_9MYCO|nr:MULTISPECIES: serine/threonine-protein kinase [Mycolicibacterium]MCV7335354.1 serine/threonine protein kinase [Mycolicibacterium senegalense]MDR7290692.1 serine/threonine protein kinase [Mycolicibacterium senegalense]QZA22262.1 serine/threonine protein kinase [Mycolicibacterium senegalense]CDP89233.1 serine/threonine protein kinase [Mycolicibacterium farcinogenes]STZ53955.1 serine/threonine protein kinase [Mycolicibacterium senegalense]
MQITAIAGYRVIRQLGAGGMGQVFLVQHPRLPRQDALKLLDAGVSRNDDFKVRFQREADLLAQLSHPNIVTLHDRGEFEGRLWITMEYIDGTDASELVKADGPLDPDLAVQLVGAAAAALDYAWRKQRVTHRDVKPANILVGIDETDSGPRIESVKLADFGIAKAAGESTSLTSTGMTIGTMQYISPEAIEGEEVDNRSDLYSLGCTAFHLLTGQPPFTGTSTASTMSAHLTKPVPSITTVNPHLPDGMDAVFERVLSKNPDGRYQSCAEFVTALQEATGGEVHYPASAQTLAAATLPSNEPTQARKVAAKATPPPRPKTRTVPIAAAVAATLAAAATAVGVYAMRGGSDEAAAPAETSTTATVTTSVSAPPSSAQSAPLPDSPSPNAGCPGTATAHHDLEHPYLGRMRVFVIPRAASYGPAGVDGACVSAVTGTGSVLMPLSVKFGYGFEFAEPATDATGNLFIRYKGGGAHDPAMVLVLVPTAQGFRTIGEDMLDTEMIGPGVDGRYVLREHQNDCTPSCAAGTWTDKDLHWDGSGYVGASKPSTPTVTSSRTVVTTAATPTISAGMPCTSPGARSSDGKFGCSGENLIWVDLNAAPLPTIGWDAIGQPCTNPGTKARLEASDGVLTCNSTGGGGYVWVSGPY